MLKKGLSLLLALSMVLILSVTAMAASNVKVSYGGADFITVPNVIGTKTYNAAGGMTTLWQLAHRSDDVTVYTVNTGTKIDISSVDLLGVLTYKISGGNISDFDNYIFDGFSGDSSKLSAYSIDLSKGKSITFNKEGLFLLSLEKMIGGIEVKRGYCLLNVGGPAGSVDTAAAEKSAGASSKSTDKNTVKVAGQDRTPGQIQDYRYGGYIYTVDKGDTLYDLAKRFYGNGGLWKELQKANQKQLNETKDGIIFVGFNLIVPETLDGVSAKVK